MTKKTFQSFKDASCYARERAKELGVTVRVKRDEADWSVVWTNIDQPLSPGECHIEEHRTQEEEERMRAVFERKAFEVEARKCELRARRWKFCRQCDGDGGATGDCPRCGGTGWEPQDE
jgi:hypothetical protein